jgi:hypothetical protein
MKHRTDRPTGPGRDEPSWGEAPRPDELAALLAERWPAGKGIEYRVEVGEEPRSLAAHLVGSRQVFVVAVTYLRGAGRDRDPWMLMADAIDALVGQLVESRMSHRELPAGTDVEHEGAFFEVRVERRDPKLDLLADHLLSPPRSAPS